MKRRICSVVICLAMIVSICGCSNEGKTITQTVENGKVVTRTEVNTGDDKKENDGKQSDDKQNDNKQQNEVKQAQELHPSNAPYYVEAISEQQLFKVEILNTQTTLWEDEDGLYIYTETDKSIPYVLIYRCKDMPIYAKDLMESFQPTIADM